MASTDPGGTIRVLLREQVVDIPILAKHGCLMKRPERTQKRGVLASVCRPCCYAPSQSPPAANEKLKSPEHLAREPADDFDRRAERV